ncbi:hypothetical protein PIB30_061752 [Stylosanthes scabra]|uniref:Uncharacterized protein n=1 Tax=Stylosanthes scabra TaxID=79078 RepID=A0ABU6TKT1_9FABA|nr:hypothetical protein [Stylosanthes scabra]
MKHLLHTRRVTEEKIGNVRREIKKRGRETAAPVEVEDTSVAVVEPRWKRGNGKLEREKWTEAVTPERGLPPHHHPAAASRVATPPPLVPEKVVVPSPSLELESPLPPPSIHSAVESHSTAEGWRLKGDTEKGKKSEEGREAAEMNKK